MSVGWAACSRASGRRAEGLSDRRYACEVLSLVPISLHRLLSCIRRPLLVVRGASRATPTCARWSCDDLRIHKMLESVLRSSALSSWWRIGGSGGRARPRRPGWAVRARFVEDGRAVRERAEEGGCSCTPKRLVSWLRSARRRGLAGELAGGA